MNGEDIEVADRENFIGNVLLMISTQMDLHNIDEDGRKRSDLEEEFDIWEGNKTLKN